MPGCAGCRNSESGQLRGESPVLHLLTSVPITTHPPFLPVVSQGARATVGTPGQVHGMPAPPDPLSTHLLRALGRLLGGINGSLVPQFPAALDTEAPAGGA